MSDPTPIDVEEGEPVQIINKDDVQMGVPFICEVYQNPVRFAHSKRAADRGATLSAGIPHTLSNFRGKGIWVAAFDGDAQVRVRPAGADFDSQPTKEVTVEGDVNVGSAIGLEDSDGSPVDPATAQKQDEIISLLEQIETNTSA